MTVGFVLVFATACGPGGNSSQPTPADGQPTAGITPSGQAAAESCTTGPIEGAQEAHMTSNTEIVPSDFTVPVGASITWFNDTSLVHTLTFDVDPDCGYVVVNGSASVTFDTPGVFAYLCRIYPAMRGTVIVQ